MWSFRPVDSRYTITLYRQSDTDKLETERILQTGTVFPLPVCVFSEIQIRNSMITRESSLTSLKGVGEKTAQLFAVHGINTVGDLLDFYPRDYDYYAAPVTADGLKEGETASVLLTVLGAGKTAFAGRYRITNFRAADATGAVRLTYFNMPYISKNLQPGTIHVFRGMVRKYQNGTLQMEQPAVFSPAEYEKLENTFSPKYSLFRGIRNGQIQKLVKTALASCSLPEDYLPGEDRGKLSLMEEKEAGEKIHFPGSREEMVRARNRKVFDEFLSFLLTIRRQKKAELSLKNTRPMHPSPETGRLICSLPYELTDSQKKAWGEIERDLTGSQVMNRLLQGDVGSGKTILAFLALLLCAANGRQGTLMAPTEVLAMQHMKDLSEMTETYGLPIHPVLLTGSVTGKARRKALEEIRSGAANAVIGTHALIQEPVEYNDLGLVITDEQHRFGVRQRETLAEKGEETPVLVMSATPIPRTLSIILYGDLQVSRLTELPKNRLRIRNLAAPSSDRGKIYRFLLQQLEEGRQAYVICPAVEENGLEQMENVTEYAENLRKVLPETVRIAQLNGRMKPKEKSAVMDAFAAHEIDILVSTTVIEVGINVPNATCILIENAERFGLSQLHQLRGRVGRGKWQSYCVFLYSDTLTEKPKRLSILEKTNDGFEIAEQDLKLRGPGDLFGVRQSGEMGFHLADIYEDADVLRLASGYADDILARDPDFRGAGLRKLDFRSI